MTVKLKTGHRYGYLTLLREVEAKWIYRQIECRCDCWVIKVYKLHNVRHWRTTSCGCYRDSQLRKNLTTHGMTNSRIYKIYQWIKQRCSNSKGKSYTYYGRKGIICEWKSFKDFYIDMWPTYQAWLSIDRIDNNWNYCKDNCRWATTIEQARNKSNNRMYNWVSIAEFCELYHLDYTNTYARIRSGKRTFKELISCYKKKL